MRSTLPMIALLFAASAPALATESVSVPSFRAVELRGGGHVTVVPGPVQRVTMVEGSTAFTRFRVQRDGLKIDTCNERCPQHYQMRVEIQSPTVPHLAVSGGGEIVAGSGFRPQRELATAVNGGGVVDARAVEAADSAAAVHGGGKIFVQSRDSLAAAVMGGGEIRYWGNPQVSTAIQGGGVVRPGS